MNIFVVDNFLAAPVAARDLALSQQFLSPEQCRQLYNIQYDLPGLRTRYVEEIDGNYAALTIGGVAAILEKQTNRRTIGVRSYFHLTNANSGDSWVHRDNSTYAGLLYLTPNALVETGTTFYQCRDIKKWEALIENDEDPCIAKSINSVDRPDLYADIFAPVESIGNVFNRLALYRGDIFHKSSKYFGAGIDDARLTQVFFINSEKA